MMRNVSSGTSPNGNSEARSSSGQLTTAGTTNPLNRMLSGQIAGGAWLPAAEIETAQKRATERAVLLATCRAAGAKNDPAKAQDLLKTGEAKSSEERRVG